MAVLMAFTALVFVAPQKVSAVTSESYSFKIVAYLTNEAKWNQLDWTVKGRANNGTGNVSTLMTKGYILVGELKKNYTICEGSSTSFPTSFEMYARHDDAQLGRRLEAKLTFYVKGPNTDWVAVPITMRESSRSGFGGGKIDNNSDGTVNINYENDYNILSGKDNNMTLTATVSSNAFPKVASVECVTAPASSYTIPKDGTVEVVHETYAKDQYGARMALTPTVSFDSTSKAGITSSTSDATDKYTHKLVVDGSAKMDGSEDNRAVKMSVSYTMNNSTKACQHEFTLLDPEYTFSFKNSHGGTATPQNNSILTRRYGNTFGFTPSGSRDGFEFLGYFLGGEVADSYGTDNTSGKTKLTSSTVYNQDLEWFAAWKAIEYKATFKYKDSDYKDVSTTSNLYAGANIVAPSVPSPISPNEDYTYTFTGWNPAIASAMPANDVVYTAQYSTEAHYADYTEVVNQINAAKEKQNEALYKEGAYTSETVTAFENALSAAENSNSNKLLKSQQPQVDTIAENLKSARENLKIKTFTVLFVDEDGAILKNGYFYVNYGAKVEAPANPSKESDANYHYEFTGWDSSDSDELSACEKVVDDLKYIAKFNAVAHSFTDTVTPSSCSADGVITHTCACGYSYTSVSETDKAHHTWSDDYKVLVPSTCATEGSEAKYCTVCGAIDEASRITTPILGHDFGDWSDDVEATCTGEGVKVRTCSRCGGKEIEKTSALGHKWKDETVVPATCTVGGYSTHTCETCAITEIFALTEAKGHSLSTTTVDATCVSTGYKETTCSNEGCDYGKLEIIPATGEHSYGEYKTVTTANCISDGVSERECSVCHKVETKITPKLTEHTFSDWETLAEETCYTDRIEQRVCEICGATETRTIDGTAHHTWADGVYTEDIPATCTTDGSESIHCTVCGASDEGTSKAITKLGHDYTNARTEVHERDCLNGKYTKTFCTRTGCDHYEIEYAPGEEGKGYGHNFSGEENVVKEATCTEDGEKTVKCLNCDATETQVIPKTGHNYLPGKEVAPTCTESGYTLMVCQNNNSHTYKQYDETKPAKGHTWSAWVVTKDSTNTEAGEMERVCTVCREAKETAVIPAGGHSFVGAVPEVVEAATCKTNGSVRYTCTAHENCGVSIVVDSEKLPHDLATDVVSATCTEDGYIKTYCKNCKEVFVNVTLTKKGHSWNAWTTKLEPTCGKDGVRIRTCANCGEVEEAVIPATGKHSYVPTEVKATCTERGHTIYSCVGCGHAYRDDFTPVLGHDFGEWEEVDATCTTPGGKQRVCRRVNENSKPCGYTEFIEDETKPATGHNMSEWTFVTHPTVKNAYAKWRQCLNPGCTHDEHESGAGPEHEAADGINIYYVVDYYNEWVTDTYDTLTQNMLTQRPATYTQLAKTYKTEKMSSVYVLKNTEAVYDGKTPWRDKDVNWGAYDFLGWSLESGKQAGEGTAADLSAITKNTSVYALFSGKDVYYSVIFYNANGETLTIREHILHGHAAEYPAEFGTPSMKDNVQFKFKFRGWSYDFSKVYDDVGIFARYDATLKKYTLVYRDWDGTELGREEITHGGVAENVPEVQERAEDNTYVYAFLNKWTLKNGDEVDLKNFSIPVGVNEGDEINIYASHTKRAKVYKVTFDVVDPYYQVCGGVNVQVMDSKGQLLSAKLTELDGSVEFSLTYDVYYKVSFLRGNYYKEGTFTLDPSSPGSINVVQIIGSERTYHGSVVLENNVPDGVDEKCKCICHSFLSGIWITFLNLLYRVFGIKHVCCSDMYVVHGDKLTYGH